MKPYPPPPENAEPPGDVNYPSLHRAAISQTTAAIYVLSAAALWGGSTVARKYLLSSVSPYVLVFTTTWIASLYLLVRCRFPLTAFYSFSRADLVALVFLATISSLAAPLAYNAALLYLDASVVAMAEKSQPVFTLTLGYFILGERYPRVVLVTGAIILAAAITLTFTGHHHATATPNYYYGLALVMAAAFAWSTAAILAKSLLTRVAPATMLFGRLLLAGVLLLPTLAISSLRAGLVSLTLLEFLVLTVIGAVCIAEAYLMFYRGLSRMTAGLSGLLEITTPVVALCLAYPLLGEEFSTSQWASALVIISGCVFLSRSPSRANTARG